MGLTIDQAADEAPMSPTTWSKIEAGGKVRALAYAAVDKVLEWREGASERFLRDGLEPQLNGIQAADASGGDAARRPPAPTPFAPESGPSLPGPVRSTLESGQVREWRILPSSDPDSEETMVVFWVGPADADMGEVAKEAAERRRRGRTREAEAIAEQQRWNEIIEREEAEAQSGGDARSPDEVYSESED
jgi:hypothetical protein